MAEERDSEAISRAFQELRHQTSRLLEDNVTSLPPRAYQIDPNGHDTDKHAHGARDLKRKKRKAKFKKDLAQLDANSDVLEIFERE
ncbi:hypothetical protein KIPB_009278, partial [Kipferlia bialata]|eukprot:g9278.t1